MIKTMTYIILFYFLCGMMDVMVGGLRGIGSSIIPMIVSLIGVCVLRIAWIYSVFKKYQTLDALYVSYPISWLMTLLVLVLCYEIVSKQLKNKLELALK